MNVTLRRFRYTDEGTPGELQGFDFEFPSLELPWENNQPRISCIPPGEYECVWHHSPKFGNCYHVTNVPDRSRILIHAGNYAGGAGYRSDVLGCILLGMTSGRLSGQRAVLRSRDAIREFHRAMAKQPFTLTIVAPPMFPPALS